MKFIKEDMIIIHILNIYVTTDTVGYIIKQSSCDHMHPISVYFLTPRILGKQNTTNNESLLFVDQW